MKLSPDEKKNRALKKALSKEEKQGRVSFKSARQKRLQKEEIFTQKKKIKPRSLFR